MGLVLMKRASDCILCAKKLEMKIYHVIRRGNTFTTVEVLKIWWIDSFWHQKFLCHWLWKLWEWVRNYRAWNSLLQRENKLSRIFIGMWPSKFSSRSFLLKDPFLRVCGRSSRISIFIFFFSRVRIFAFKISVFFYEIL